MGEVYSHLSEEERQVIQIEVGNGASIRGIGAMLGRSPSSISREIKRNTWFPSNENESYRPYRPKRLKAGPWTGRYYIAGPAQRKADRRSAFGHWEADSVIGVGCNLHTEVERRTRFLMARIVPDKTAGESVGAQLDMFSPLPAGARVSVTHDNGTEFAHHERLRDGLGMATYFADPYSSWQRGSNENRNGMIRRYLPKRCEIRMDMAKEVREIVDEINNRPMRVLDYRTPAEAFADELLELQDQQGCCTSK